MRRAHLLTTWILFAISALPSGSTAAALPAEPTGVIAGFVGDTTIDGRFRPSAFTNVILRDHRVGAATDEAGHFVMAPVTAGTYVVEIRAIGVPRQTMTVTVRAGETTHVVHSLATKSEGPPGTWKFRPPDARVLERLSSSTSMAVYRLDPEMILADPPPPGTPDRLGRYRVVSQGRPPGTRERQGFIAMIADTLSWVCGWRGKKLCSPAPGVGVRFFGPQGVTDFEFCLECRIGYVQTAGIASGGEFDPVAAEMLRFFRRAFPRDRALKELDARDRASERNNRR